MANSSLIVTGIGSMPHPSPEAALDLISSSLPQAPHWPQLPQRDYHEQMLCQCTEGLPDVRYDKARQVAYFQTDGDFLPELEEFYANYLAFEDSGVVPDAFAISPAFAAGLHALIERLSKGTPPDWVKGQIPGPFSFGLGVTDESRKAIYYNESFQDVVIKGLALKGAWMAQALKPLARRVIIFVDEPILTGFGSSALVTISREEVISRFNEVIAPIKTSGALVGSHCCGNTDWSLFAESKLDLISFDAYNHAPSLGLYADAITAFLRRGGILSWGIIPTEAIDREDAESLSLKLRSAIDGLAAQGVPESLLRSQVALTPSCGVGTLSIAQTEKVYRILAEFSRHNPLF